MRSRKNLRRHIYIGINTLLLLFAFFGCGYYLLQTVRYGYWKKFSLSDFLIILLFLLLSQSLKALKLELFFAETGLKIYKALQLYVKTTFISFIAPFKLGEIFKFYCFGYHTDFAGSFFRVMLDRFLDICALLSILLFSGLFFPLHANLLIIILSVCILLLTIGYLQLHPQCKYWNNLLIAHTNSAKTIYAQRFIDKLFYLYQMTRRIQQGRAFVVYLMSLVAWLLELVAIVRVNRVISGEYADDISIIGKYFTDVLCNNGGTQIQIFTSFSMCAFVILLILLYLFQKGAATHAK